MIEDYDFIVIVTRFGNLISDMCVPHMHLHQYITHTAALFYTLDVEYYYTPQAKTD